MNIFFKIKRCNIKDCKGEFVLNKSNVELLPHLPKSIVRNIGGFKLDAYLVALEGWRKGLQLKWYKNESPLCEIDKLNSSTQGKFFSLSSDNRLHYFFRSRGDKVANEAVRVCQSKEKTKEIIKSKGLSIPKGTNFQASDSNIIKYAEEIGYPVVIKPLNGSMGKGVYTNLRNGIELESAAKDYQERFQYNRLIVEKYYPGNEYRVYVVGDKVIAATKRVPANIIGDGLSNVQELINQKNIKRKENPYLAPKPIKVDYEVLNSLKKIGYTLESVPRNQEWIQLRSKSNLSSGGDPIDATDSLSDEIKDLAVNTLKAIPEIPHAGVDIIVAPENNKQGVVLEVNATAEIAFHMFPLVGKARDIPKALIDYYFPEVAKNERSRFYFDFDSIMEPLKTWAAEEIVVSSIPKGQLNGIKFIVSGKVVKVGYMNWIKRQALLRGFHGFSKIKNGNVEVTIFGPNLDDLENFKKQCFKGSKRSKVEHVKVVPLNFKKRRAVNLGFRIISKK